MVDDNISEIGPEQLDAVLHFLPIFSQQGYTFGAWREPKGHVPYYVMNDEVKEFFKTVNQQNIVFAFNWGNWQDEAQRYISNPAYLEQTDLLTLRKLLTTHIRADRYIEGHLASMLESGHITAILLRLLAIRQKM